MPFTYQIDQEHELLLLVGEGVITQPERMATLRACLSDPAFRPEFNTLCDFSKAESIPTLPELRAVAELVGRTAPTGRPKRAAIITAKTITFGVARQFAAIAESDRIEIQIFTNREDAWAWLHTPHDPLPSAGKP